MTVSVALCTHNGEQFIAEQLQSILSQTQLPKQIVISDDDSRDETLRVVRELVANHERDGGHPVELRVLQNQPALGVARNFEQAIRACDGDLIALCDQDDIWVPERLAVITQYFSDNPDVILVHGDARLIDDDGSDLGRTLFESLRVSPRERRQVGRGTAMDTFIRRNLVTGATTMFRRELVEKALPVPDGWIHDEWLGIMAAILGRVVIVPGLLVSYRQHAANQIGAQKLTVRRAIGKLREPRSERNRNLLLRAQSLADRILELGSMTSPRNYRLAVEKLEHERFRLALPVNHLRRLIPVFVSLASGKYHRYGLGAQDAFRDLVQPV